MCELSVIIPGYNTPNEWWDRCLGSVLAALPEDGEIICVDDGSRMRPEVSVVDPRIKWIYLEKNGGQSAARNRALEEARGEYVTFVDSDDEALPGAYNACLRRVEQVHADVVLFGVRVIWMGLGLTKDNVMTLSYTGELTDSIAERVYRECLLEYPVNKLYRREFLNRHQIYFPVGMCPGEDTIFNLKVIKAKSVWTFVDEVGYVYYRYDGSSLSRYLPTNLAATRVRANLWKETFSFAHEECTEAENLKSEWENIWRYDSPISLKERYRFSRQYGYGFVGMLIKTFCRRHLYFKAVRKWKVKRMYPSVRNYGGIIK